MWLWKFPIPRQCSVRNFAHTAVVSIAILLDKMLNEKGECLLCALLKG